MKVIVYKCNLCEQSWEEKDVFGISIDDNDQVVLVDPEDVEKHICRGCMLAIKNYGADGGK
jgi:hypothetical protein